MKLALAQIDAAVGDLRGNTEKILAALDESARRGAALAVFPEQSLGGYPALDLWEERGFDEANEKALAALAKKALMRFILKAASPQGIIFIKRWKEEKKNCWQTASKNASFSSLRKIKKMLFSARPWRK